MVGKSTSVRSASTVAKSNKDPSKSLVCSTRKSGKLDGAEAKWKSSDGKWMIPATSMKLEKLVDENKIPLIDSVRSKIDVDGSYITVRSKEKVSVSLTKSERLRQIEDGVKRGYERVIPRSLTDDAAKKTKKLEDDVRAQKRKKHIAIIVSIILAVFLIGAVLGIIMLFVTKAGCDKTESTTTTATSTTSLSTTIRTTPTPTTIPVPTTTPESVVNVIDHFEATCGALFSKRNECFMATPPESCIHGGVCTELRYRINKITDESSDNVFSFVDEIDQFPEATPLDPTVGNHVCRLGAKQLGVCSNGGECDRPYDGQFDSDWFKDGEWEDTCGDGIGEPGPCWSGSMAVFRDHQRLRTRDECLTTAKCEPYKQDAIVYMQHLRCKTGINGMARRICKGLPMRLRVCQECSQKSVPNQLCPKSSNFTALEKQCGVNCFPQGSASLTYAVPNGVECVHSSGDKAYCFQGQCMPAYKGTDPLLSTDECKAKKSIDVTW